MGFLGHNFGSRQDRRSNKGSIGRLSSFQTKFQAKIRPIGLASRARQSWSKKRKHPHFANPSRVNPPPKSKKFFNRTKRTCCTRGGLEQLSSYSSWRVITKKARAHLLARAVGKALNARPASSLTHLRFLPQTYCKVACSIDFARLHLVTVVQMLLELE